MLNEGRPAAPSAGSRPFHFAFAWELGGGFGHLVRYRRLIRALLAAGHRVSFLARDPVRAAAVFEGLPVRVEPAAHDTTPAAQRVPVPQNFAEVLNNSGFHDELTVAARVARWRTALAALAPDAVLADYSPSALLACRAMRLPVVASGSGFCAPPRASPLPPLRPWHGCDRARMGAAEAAVLARMNAALTALDAPPATELAALVTTPASLLLTFRELDHYLDRSPADYLGCFPDDAFGRPPQWPPDGGPRVFAYLDPRVLLEPLLAALGAIDAAVCLYAPGLEPAAVPAPLGRRFKLMTEPAAMVTAARDCDLAVSNANLNTVATMLLAGKPQLVVPYTLEKYIVGRRLEVIGGGLAAPRGNPGDLGAKLRALLRQRSYRRAAERFAARYAEDGADRQTARLMARMMVLAERASMNKMQ